MSSRAKIFCVLALGSSIAACTEAPPSELEAPATEQTFATGSSDFAYAAATNQTGVYVISYTEGDMDGPNAGSIDVSVRRYHPSGDLIWGRQFGTWGSDFPIDIAVDAAGNSYAAGYTAAALAGNWGGPDGFVRKHDIDGNVIWTRQFGTTTSDIVYAVAVDAGGYVYVSGETLGAFGGPSAGNKDVFVLKLSPAGDELWRRQFGTTLDENPYQIASDASGAIYVAGTTNGNLATTHLGNGDVFVRKYSAAGSALWTVQFGTSGSDAASGIAVDSEGRVVVAGRTNGSLGGPNAGNTDGFFRKLTKGGGTLATVQFGTSSSEVVTGVAIDDADNIYLSGQTSGALGGPSAGLDDAFVRKYSSNHVLRWTSQFGTNSIDSAYGVAVADPRAVFVVGATYGSLVSNRGGPDAFIRRLDANGNRQWTDQ